MLFRIALGDLPFVCVAHIFNIQSTESEEQINSRSNSRCMHRDGIKWLVIFFVLSSWDRNYRLGIEGSPTCRVPWYLSTYPRRTK